MNRYKKKGTTIDDREQNAIAIWKWKKQYALKLIARGFSVADVCGHIEIHTETFYKWRKMDKPFAEKLRKIEEELEKIPKPDFKTHIDLVALVDKIRPYLQRHLTEKEACAESWINYDTYKHLKHRMGKSKEPVAIWFLQEIAQAKLKIYSLAKNTLTSWIKVNPTLAFNFLKSVQPDIYTDGRKELTGAKGEKLFHAFPMKPWDYEAFLKQASKSGDEEDE